MSDHKYTNLLSQETSPYLLQHAHNPVEWIPWSEDAFELAKIQHKMVLVSVGYSACHWCHVMEHESFEDEEIAAIMNEHFICIKVDREERPDVDQVYMTAVQLMTQRGGWPLNCFTLPNGKPIYGGTYFPSEQWKQILRSLVYTFHNDPEKVESYAENLTEGVQQSELITTPEHQVPFDAEKLKELVLRWSKNFDQRDGGSSRAPKFPLPNNYEFLLQYALQTGNNNLLKHVHLTLKKMCYGGIYDQIGGGFARYSVDMLWKVPHFEKMLYDNAQLISLYAKAYAVFQDDDFKQVVQQTIDWLIRDMRSDEGYFYSAIDADSEGEEGKFYVWKQAELKTVLGDDYEFACTYYKIDGEGYWEDGNYILMRKHATEFINNGTLNPENHAKIAKINDLLRNERENRIHPGIDKKRITAWNAQLVVGLLNAYRHLGTPLYFDLANNLIQHLLDVAYHDKTVYRIVDHTKKIEGFLDDYAAMIEALIQMHQVTLNPKWSELALEMSTICRTQFQDDKSPLFYYTNHASQLIARKMEINDNVIPASNSIMANNLYQLGVICEQDDLVVHAEQMIASIYDGMEHYGSGYSNWSIALSRFIFRQFTLKFSGNTQQSLPVFHAGFHPNVLFQVEISADKDAFYLCYDQQCDAPTTDAEAILARIKHA